MGFSHKKRLLSFLIVVIFSLSFISSNLIFNVTAAGNNNWVVGGTGNNVTLTTSGTETNMAFGPSYNWSTEWAALPNLLAPVAPNTMAFKFRATNLAGGWIPFLLGWSPSNSGTMNSTGLFFNITTGNIEIRNCSDVSPGNNTTDIANVAVSTDISHVITVKLVSTITSTITISIDGKQAVSYISATMASQLGFAFSSSIPGLSLSVGGGANTAITFDTTNTTYWETIGNASQLNITAGSNSNIVDLNFTGGDHSSVFAQIPNKFIPFANATYGFNFDLKSLSNWAQLVACWAVTSNDPISSNCGVFFGFAQGGSTGYEISVKKLGTGDDVLNPVSINLNTEYKIVFSCDSSSNITILLTTPTITINLGSYNDAAAASLLSISFPTAGYAGLTLATAGGGAYEVSVDSSPYPNVNAGNYKLSSNAVTNITQQTSLTAFSAGLTLLQGATISFSNSLGTAISDLSTSVKTGTIVNITNNGITDPYSMLIYGDVNGDGAVNLSDLVSIRNCLLGTSPLSSVQQAAGDLYGEGGITLNDLVGVMAYVVQSGTINQNRFDTSLPIIPNTNPTVNISGYSNTGSDDATIINSAISDLGSKTSSAKLMGENITYHLLMANKTYSLNNSLSFSNINNLQFDGNNATFNWTVNTCGFYMPNCKNVTVENLSVDYTPMLYTQGTVTSDDGTYVTMSVDPGFPDSGWVLSGQQFYSLLYNPVTGAPKDGNAETDFYTNVTNVSSMVLRLKATFVNTQYGLTNPAIGDKITLYPSPENGAFIIQNDGGGMQFINLNIYQSAGVGISESSGVGGMNINNVNVIPGPAPLGTSTVRLMSALADSFHFGSVRTGPTINNCTASGCADDGVNVQGFFFHVLSVSGNTITVTPKWDAPPAIGDTVEGYLNNGYVSTGTATITNFVKRDDPTETAAIIAAYANMDSTIQDTSLVYDITTDKPLGVSAGDHITSLNCIGSGAVIENSTFKNNRARGVVVRGQNDIIKNNTFDRNSSAAISVGPDAYWCESGFPVNVSILNNTITNSATGGDMIKSSTNSMVGSICVSTVPTTNFTGFYNNMELNNIDIEGNSITNSQIYGIFAANCNGLTIKNNTIVNPFQNGIGSALSLYSITPNSGIFIGKSENITVTGNSVTGNSSVTSQAVTVDGSCIGSISNSNNPVTITSPIPVTGVTLDKSTMSVGKGATGNLSTTIAPSNASNKAVTWTSSATGVATVNSSGVVTAVATGSATITATASGSKTATCVVTVTRYEPTRYYKITYNSGSTLAMDTTTTGLGGAIKNVTYTGADSQQWQIILNSDGTTYRVVNKATGYVLNDNTTTNTTGKSIIQSTYVNQASMNWTINDSGSYVQFYTSVTGSYSNQYIKSTGATGGALVTASSGTTTRWVISLLP